MKVLIKLTGQIETVENVSVDSKCFPVVAGLHPYPSAAADVSPLVRESALWFKTLAVEAVYIDCDRKCIYWAPIINSADAADVLLRRSTTETPVSNDFIPASAKPLFKDNSVYDFDASLKEMMSKCSEAVRKLFKKSHSINEFHKIIAKILHLYILPSITFTAGDMFCLTRAQCLIDGRLHKSEIEIANKANSIMNLRQCRDTLKNNLFLQENLDSERYLRTCNKDFLRTFLKTVESDVECLNNELSAQQSKVDWAKQHPDELYKLSELQQKRDCLFQEIDKFIRVREAIKNVISRRDLTKKKKTKCEVKNNCFHNVFVEVIRRLELEERLLGDLGNDKVNICAAREAAECTILEMDDTNRNSDRATKFEPEDFADYYVNEGENIEKSTFWLTFQGRVARVIEDVFSSASKVHREGCRSLNLKINVALSEFELTNRKANRIQQDHQSAMAVGLNSSSNTTGVTMRHSKTTAENSGRRDTVVINRKCYSGNTSDLLSDIGQDPTLQSTKANNKSDTNADFIKRRARLTNNLNSSLPENQLQTANAYCDDNLNKPIMRRNTPDSFIENNLVLDHFLPVDETAHVERLDDSGSSECPLKRQRHVMSTQLALGSLMRTVETLKVQIRNHFTEVIGCLVTEITMEEKNEASEVEQQELLWKSYDRYFCQEVYGQLMKLYEAGLTPSMRKAYGALRKTTLQEILEGDKLLELFFGDQDVIGRASLISPRDLSDDKLSMARTLSDLSLDVRCCGINELYTLANVDSTDISKRFSLDLTECDEESVQTSSSGSQKSTDFSSDEETVDVMNSASASTTSAKSATSSGIFNKEDLDEADIWTNVNNFEDILDRVLSPFKKLVGKCLDATCVLDKVRYITKMMEGLNNDISQMIGPHFKSACDDILSMMILALYNLPEEMFIGLYINLRLILDVLPQFLSGSIWDYYLVTLCASYDHLFTRKVCELVVRQFPSSFRVRR